jgi:L-ribulose-5-phosphate 4-epimerase
MVLVASHGPFTWGKLPQEAVYHAVVLEEISKMAINTEKINPDIKSASQSLVDKHFSRKHGKDAYYGQKKS